MNTRKHLVSAILAAVIIVSYPQLLRAETFTSGEFLTWKSEQRIAYIQNSITMVGIVATQLDKEKARCIDAWHSKQINSGHPVVLRAMRKHADYHPQAIVLWILQKECGKLNPDE